LIPRLDYLSLSMTAPALGAIPITSFASEENAENIFTEGS
jgi:hypothetical protein